MNLVNSYNLEKFDLDPKKLERMKFKIIAEERHNVKTKERKKEEMIEKLKNIIIEEVKKKY